MRYWLLLAVIPAFLHLAGAQGIQETETRRFQAQIDRDTVLLQELLADDLVYIHSNALTETKSDFIKSVKTGYITYQVMQHEGNPVIRRFGKTAISNGVVQVKGLLNANSFDMRLRYTAVYQKQKQAWRLVSWQSTRIP